MKLFTRKHYLPWFRRKKLPAKKARKTLDWTIKVDGNELVVGESFLFVGDDRPRRNGIYKVTSIG